MPPRSAAAMPAASTPTRRSFTRIPQATARTSRAAPTSGRPAIIGNSPTNTTGFQNITIQWNQASSNTGPRDFQLAWSTDGTNFTNLGGQYMVLPNAAPNPVWNATTSS